MRSALTLVLVAFAGYAQAQQPLVLDFAPATASSRAAADEYAAIWAKEGARIVAAMERRTGLRFEPGPIAVSIAEATSFSGERGGRPMILRASYPEPTKRGTLVHELAHRLAADVRFTGDHHELIFLFLYDVWSDLWGQPFADEQVAIESRRQGFSDYNGIWKKTLALDVAERTGRLQRLVGAK